MFGFLTGKIAIVAVILASALAAGTAWKVQEWRYTAQIDAIRLDIAEAKIIAAQEQTKAVREAREAEQEYTRQAEAALKEAREREQQSRTNAVAANRTAGELRDNLAAIKAGLPHLTERAVRERAATLSGLLGDCAAEYSEMAGLAQRHADDVKLLQDSWPKKSPD